MDAFTYKCPGCDGALIFDPDAKQLFCDYCIQYYDEDFLQNQKMKAPSMVSGIPGTDHIEVPEGEIETIDMRLYHCSSCGAELMTTDVEVSRFCSYCGQPTIIFDRISKERKPEKIIPFKITKEEALRNVNEKFKDAILMDGRLEDIKTDSVYAIYMPYWIFNLFYYMRTSISIETGKNSVMTVNDMISDTKDVILDASERFNDDISILLNPYNMEEAEDFSPIYLSGYYADRSDVESGDRRMDAVAVLRKQLSERVLNHTNGVPNKRMRDIIEHDRTGILKKYRLAILEDHFEFYKKTYALLPVYFITFQFGQKKAIVLVNGQTGKIVGNIPSDDEQVRKRQIKDSIFFGIIGALVASSLLRYMPIEISAFLVIIVCSIFYSIGKTAKRKYIERYYKTNCQTMFDISKHREEHL